MPVQDPVALVEGSPPGPGVAADGEVVRISFAPTIPERCGAMIALLAGLGGIAGFVAVATRSPASLVCKRSTRRCEYDEPSWIGSHSTATFEIASLHDSRLVKASDEPAYQWRVSRSVAPFEDLRLSDWQRDEADVQQLHERADRFERFLVSDSRPMFVESFAGDDTTSKGSLVLLALVGLAGSFAIARGWRADLVFDRSAGTVTVRRRPMFFTGPCVVTAPTAEVDVVVRQERYHGNRWAAVELRRRGSTLFRRTLSAGVARRRADEVERGLGRGGTPYIV